MTGKKAPCLLKKIMGALSSKSNELRVRFMIFHLLHKNMEKTSLAHSFSHSVVAPQPDHHINKKYKHKQGEEESNDIGHLLMYYNKVNKSRTHIGSYETNVEKEDPDLTRVLFEESEAAMEEERDGVAVAEEGHKWGLEVVKEVVAEENIDEAADLFIKRFKREIQLQKQHSFETHQMPLLSNS